jgi:hypothetical protein
MAWWQRPGVSQNWLAPVFELVADCDEGNGEIKLALTDTHEEIAQKFLQVGFLACNNQQSWARKHCETLAPSAVISASWVPLSV